MAKQTIGIGTAANDGTGDPLRTAFTKANDNFTELYNNLGEPYIAGRYYPMIKGVPALGSVPTLLQVSLVLFRPRANITVTELGARVSTTSAGGKFQLGIYANDPATMRPTGAVLASTQPGAGNGLSTTAAGLISGACYNSSGVLGDVALTGGTAYWYGLHADNTTARYVHISDSFVDQMADMGSATAANILTSATNGQLSLVATGQTYGTWADLTGATFVEGSAGRGCVPVLKAI